MEALFGANWQATMEKALQLSYGQAENINWDMVIIGVFGILIGTFVYEVVCLIARKRSIPALRRILFVIILAWWVYTIVDITILQRGVMEQSLSLSVFSKDEWYVNGHLDKYKLLYALLNVLLFVPVGFLLSGIMPRGNWFITVMVICLIGSFAIEAAQFYYHLGKSDIEDLITNTAGGFIGYFIGWLFMFGKHRAIAMHDKGKRKAQLDGQ